MSELGKLMKRAAGRTGGSIDADELWRRGRILRAQRTILASGLAVVLLGGLTAFGLAMGDGAGRDSRKIPAATAPAEECRDRTGAWMGEGKETAQCIASGTTDGIDWFYGAYVNEEGDLCDVLITGGEDGAGCGSREGEIREIHLGLTWGGPLDPALTAEIPAGAAEVVVETAEGESVPMDVFDAPPEIPHSLKFGLLFNLPRHAERVVALDEDGNRVATESLEGLFETMDEFDRYAQGGDGDGWLIDYGVIQSEPWSLDADQQSGDGLCAGLGLGNDERAAEVEVHALFCRRLSEATLHLEQMWWDDLGDLAPVFGFVPRAADRVTLEIEGSPAEEIPIRKSPTEGLWDEYVYPVDFVVAFPPLGEAGRIVVYDSAGEVMAEWQLCLTEGDTEGRDYVACSATTEFWTPSTG